MVESFSLVTCASAGLTPAKISSTIRTECILTLPATSERPLSGTPDLSGSTTGGVDKFARVRVLVEIGESFAGGHQTILADCNKDFHESRRGSALRIGRLEFIQETRLEALRATKERQKSGILQQQQAAGFIL